MCLDDRLRKQENEFMQQAMEVYNRYNADKDEKFAAFLPAFEHLLQYTPFTSGEILVATNKNQELIYLDSDLSDIDQFLTLMPLGFQHDGYQGIFGKAGQKKQIIGTEFGIIIRTKKSRDQVWNETNITQEINSPEEKINDPSLFPYKFSLTLRDNSQWEGNIINWINDIWKSEKKHYTSIEEMQRMFMTPFLVKDENKQRVKFLYNFGFDTKIPADADQSIIHRPLSGEETERIESACQRFGYLMGIVLNDTQLDWLAKRERDLRVQVEQQSEQLAVARAKEAAQSTLQKAVFGLTGGMAHFGLNNAASMQFDIEMLSEAIKNKDYKSATEFLTELNDINNENSTYLNDMHEIVKKGRVKIVEPVDLNDIVKSTLNKYNQSELHINTTYANTSLVKGSKSQYTGIIDNFVSNAVKAVKDKDNQTIDVVLEEATQGITKGIQLSVTDNGKGIKPKQLQDIGFTPYINTDTPTQMGTGFGLVHAKIVLGLYEGDYEIESTPGQGTTVTAFFPYEQKNGHQQ